MPSKLDQRIVNAIRESAQPLTGGAEDYDALLARIGEDRVVLLGEASHGTHEFYRIRALITKRLILEKGFNAVAVEADWPDAYRVNRFVRCQGPDLEASDALTGFKRFPTWMWRNADVLDFVGWLRDFNERNPDRQAGFYGLDLYSLHASMRAVLDYLDKVDPEGARRARHRYACFDHFGEDSQAYGYATGFGLSESCEHEVLSQWLEMRARTADLARRDGRVGSDAFFFAEQNARLVKNAEEYYRSMFMGQTISWNMRDRHMFETFSALVGYLGAARSKVVVWAHNSHLGDARATEMGRHGELNLGQLMREHYGNRAILAGFTTYAGTVTAATDWDGPAERKRVRPALPGSYEALFHESRQGNFLLLFGSEAKQAETALALSERHLERAIGVIYRPKTERASHYFEACLPKQFDAIIHFDESRAVEPMEREAQWERGEIPETYPSAL